MFLSVVQTSAASIKEQDEAYEMLKPLARYVDDEDLEKMLKERKRDGDPMLMFMRSTKKSVDRNFCRGLLYIIAHFQWAKVITSYCLILLAAF